MFRVQFLYRSPAGLTAAMEETEIVADDLACALQAISEMRPWPCDADAVRVVDDTGSSVLMGTPRRDWFVVERRPAG
jgi:hypothetical protein